MHHPLLVWHSPHGSGHRDEITHRRSTHAPSIYPGQVTVAADYGEDERHFFFPATNSLAAIAAFFSFSFSQHQVEEVLLPEAREEYSNVLEDTRHPANKELYSAQDLKRARDEAKQDVER